jgi:accessory Sec system protein Asp3
MLKSSFLIKWAFNTDQTYNFGSKIQFYRGKVMFHNPKMSPGAPLHTWHSLINYQKDYKTSDLPLLEEGCEYELTAMLKATPAESIHLQLEFFDAQDQLIENQFITSLSGRFTTPKALDHYTISLVNLNNRELEFSHLILRPLECKVSIEMHNGPFKIVMLWEANQRHFKELNVAIRPKVLTTGAYIETPRAIQVNVEITRASLANEDKIQAAVKQTSAVIQSFCEVHELDFLTVATKIIATQNPTPALQAFQKQLATALSNLEE